MRTILTVALLVGCTSSPNYWITYAPIRGSTTADRAAAVQKAVVAVTDAGKEVETSDVATGIVMTKWFSGDAALVGDQDRFRIRVTLNEQKGFEIVALCQHKDGSSWGGDCGEKRPRFVVDTMKKIDAELE